jgi:hypothetical protein
MDHEGVRIGEVVCLGERLVNGAGLADLAFEPHAARQVGLRVEVHQQHALFGQCE